MTTFVVPGNNRVVADRRWESEPRKVGRDEPIIFDEVGNIPFDRNMLTSITANCPQRPQDGLSVDAVSALPEWLEPPL